ncbi:MAG TPA: hypothetical protein VFC96_01045, partial [Anaerovoracaceae bacterium]|nr:hypothetical protein [Anaerovoracaceae bacterium]
MEKYSKIAVLVFADIVLVNFAFVLALLLRFDFQINQDQFIGYLAVYVRWALLITSIKVLANAAIGLYSSLWRYASIDELLRICLTAAFGFLSAAITMIFFNQNFPRSIFFIVFFLDIFLMGGLRLGYRLFHRVKLIDALRQRFSQAIDGDDSAKFSRVLIIGAGDAGASMIKEIQVNPEAGKRVIGAIDDNPTKIGTRIAGKKVLGNR